MSQMQRRTRPRKRTITIDLGRSRAVAGFAQIPDGSLAAISPTGEIIRPKSATVSSGYGKIRKDKPFKATSELTVFGRHPLHHPDLEIMKCDIVLAVDTNTITYDGVRISVTSVILGQWSPIVTAQGKMLIEPSQSIMYEFRNPKIEPEKLGWFYAIKNFQMGPLKGRKRSIGLIVDHDLANHAAIMSQTEEIAPGLLLPEEFQLIYGSSDHRNENPINSFMWFADRTATHCLKSITSRFDDRRCLIEPADGLSELTRAIRPTSLVPHPNMNAAAQALSKSPPPLSAAAD